jgi:Transposase
MAEETLAWFASVDWGSEGHQVCLVDGQGGVPGKREFPHGGAGLTGLDDWLLSIAGAASAVAVAIEVPHGPIIDSMIDRGFVVHAINPKQLDRLRDPVQCRRCSAGSMLLIHGSSNCARGRVLPRS